MLRRAVAAAIGVAALLVAGVSYGPTAGASPDAHVDPTGDQGSLPIDIFRISHTDTAETVIYWMQAAADFTDQTLAGLGLDWALTLDDENTATLAASQGGPDFSCDAQPDSLGTPTVTRASSGRSGSTAANTVQVSFPLEWLTDCGLTSNTYTYFVDLYDDENDDFAPDETDFTHTLDATPPSTTTTTTGPTTTTTAGGTTTTTTAGGTTTTTTGGGTTTTTTGGATTTTTATGGTTTTTAPGSATTTTTPGASPDTQSAGVVSDDTPAPGEQITFSASGFSGSSTLSGTLLSDPVSLGAVQSDATGAVRALFTIPVDTILGRHQIVVSGPNPGGGVHRAVADIMVLPGGRSGTLPVTGSDDVGTSVIVGLLLAVVGAGAAWWGRAAEEAEA